MARPPLAAEADSIYTPGVNPPRLRRHPSLRLARRPSGARLLVALRALCVLLTAVGCDAAALLAPTDTATTPTAPQAAALATAPVPGAQPPAGTPSPSPEAGEGIRLTFTEDAIQAWTDPNEITGLLHDGTFLWAATSGGVVRWSPESGAHRLYSQRDGLPSQAVRGIAHDAQGRLWIGYADHPAWSVYDGGAWRHYASRREAVEEHYQALRDAPRYDTRLWVRGGESAWLWMPSGDGGVQSYDGETWRTYGTRERVRPNTWMVATSAAGRVWAIGDGVSTAAEGERQWQDHSFFSDVGSDGVATGLAVDERGSLWLAFSSPSRIGGVSYLDAETRLWAGHSHALTPALPRQVYCLELDADGTLWLCGDQGLVYRPAGERWQTIPAENLHVRCFTRDSSGRLWLGTAHGIWSVLPDGTGLRGPLLLPSPLVGNEVRHLAVDSRGRLWVGTPRGLSHVDPRGAVTVVTTEEAHSLDGAAGRDIYYSTTSGLYRVGSLGDAELLSEDVVTHIVFDAAGMPWIATREGVIRRFEAGAWHDVATVSALGGGRLRDMALSADGTLWLATSSGVVRRDPDGTANPAPLNDGAPLEGVRSLALASDGTLWAATGRGLYRRHPEGHWTLLTVESTGGGLRSMDVWGLTMDAEGMLWIASSGGVSRRTPDADWFYADVPGARTVLPLPSGIIWVGTGGGLYRVQQSAFQAIP